MAKYTILRTSPRANAYEIKTIDVKSKLELDTICQDMADNLMRRYKGGKVVASKGGYLTNKVITYLNTIDYDYQEVD